MLDFRYGNTIGYGQYYINLLKISSRKIQIPNDYEKLTIESLKSYISYSKPLFTYFC